MGKLIKAVILPIAIAAATGGLGLIKSGASAFLAKQGGWPGILKAILGLVLGPVVDTAGQFGVGLPEATGDEKADRALDLSPLLKLFPGIGRWLLDTVVLWVNKQAGSVAPGLSFAPKVEEAKAEEKSLWSLLFEKALEAYRES